MQLLPTLADKALPRKKGQTETDKMQVQLRLSPSLFNLNHQHFNLTLAWNLIHSKFTNILILEVNKPLIQFLVLFSICYDVTAKGIFNVFKTGRGRSSLCWFQVHGGSGILRNLWSTMPIYSIMQSDPISTFRISLYISHFGMV